ncbi:MULTISPECIES: MarR family winged helix-turn-helix transcriptional regulator [unclassified Mesorhizobium]|uniref:MarR family winged helix-turn-helix transcriptional regulator n=1 Tax=unclassified Mesorhizobium TaxID=325217 RepID=UPI00112BBFAB|nr:MULTISPECIES: MarR family winged helix-turn-helix transcriptional regulator [unclassified Mesorhizobium]TPJ48218.1 winged helix-turn-helix transcriptional regulator [Mesorhizobium sp. B2-6-6]MBZ9699318.1 MarR family winged helix-turn-helix transcriptional regulator [Mesorhizobium sp. CO1-1-3]MBZ9945571.1 MarR family winged helix-turn-helix transcriptional regulator [Mesorhizobium sp. BR1-1-11]MBZ9955527.1 MarR family winged helix-turn-helix transcriptional regulator [Mesorhizobium sp. BR1-1-
MTDLQQPGFSRCNNATLRRTARRLGRFYDDALAPSGLKGTQFGLLFQISASSEPAMGTVAEALIMDLSALGHTLKPLVRDGYVETFPDKDDRRVKRVRLTPHGQAKLEEAIRLWSVAQQRFEEMIGAEQAAKLRATLDDVASLDLETPAAAPSS